MVLLKGRTQVYLKAGTRVMRIEWEAYERREPRIPTMLENSWTRSWLTLRQFPYSIKILET
jgi:hypothetical protein